MFVMKYRAFVMKYLFDVLFETLVRFVTCIAFVWNPELTQGYLISGSGDSTVSYLKAYSSCIFKTSIA